MRELIRVIDSEQFVKNEFKRKVFKNENVKKLKMNLVWNN